MCLFKYVHRTFCTPKSKKITLRQPLTHYSRHRVMVHGQKQPSCQEKRIQLWKATGKSGWVRKRNRQGRITVGWVVKKEMKKGTATAVPLVFYLMYFMNSFVLPSFINTIFCKRLLLQMLSFVKVFFGKCLLL